MPRTKLTDLHMTAKTVTVHQEDGSKAKVSLPPERGVVELWDSVVVGLALRCFAPSARNKDGARSFIVLTRINGKPVRRTLKAVEGVADARDQAREILRNAAKGIDIASPKARKEAAHLREIEVEREAKQTFRAVALDWLEGHTGKSVPLIRRRLEMHIFPRIGDLPIAADATFIKGRVREAVKEIARTKPVQANRCLTVIKTIFAHAADNDLIPSSPVAAVKKPAKETPCSRVLRDEEIPILVEGLDRLGPPFGPAVMLMLLTGQRKSECGKMVRSEISGEAWTIPAARYKSERDHTVPITPAIADVLASTPELLNEDGTPYQSVFSTGRAGDTPISGWSKAKARLDTLIGKIIAERAGEAYDPQKHRMDPWTFHDLRRTCRANLTAIGVTPDVGERVLGHALPSLRTTYDRHDFLDDKRDALNAWGRYLYDILCDPEAYKNHQAFLRGSDDQPHEIREGGGGNRLRFRRAVMAGGFEWAAYLETIKSGGTVIQLRGASA